MTAAELQNRNRAQLRGPEPLVRVCWFWLRRRRLLDLDRTIQSGRGAELVPASVGRAVAARLAATTGCTAWVEIEGRIG